MAKIVGVVDEVGSRSVNTKFGMKNSYFLVVGGERYAAGFKAPSVAAGDSVDLEFDSTSRYKDVISVSKRAAGDAPTKSTPAASAPAGYGGKLFPVPPLHPDRSIIRQNALAHATKVVVDFFAATVRRDGADAPTPRPFGQMDIVADEIIRVARKFEAYSTGDLDKALAENDIREAMIAKTALPEEE